MKTITLTVIAHIENDFHDKFGIPRQSGLLPEMESRIVFEKEYRDPSALKGIEGYSHLWLLWEFSENKRENWSPTVRPPRLGGNKRVGVFATRSPFRPNPVGLSSVKLQRIEHTADRGDVLVVTGADLMNGTPILDIKPYVRYTDSHPDAVSGFADAVKDYALTVEDPDNLLAALTENDRASVRTLLANDPRPSYQDDENRRYGVAFGAWEIRFSVTGTVLTVREVFKTEEERGGSM